MNTKSALLCRGGCRILLVSVLAGFLCASAAFGFIEGMKASAGPDQGNGIVRFRGVYHNVNKLLLHSSNMGFFGDWNADTGVPSGEWPAGSGIEYLFAAGLWVGGVVINEARMPDTLVTAAVYQLEFYPKPDPRDIVYVTAEGNPGGARRQDDGSGGDDDSDGLLDEDPLDGYDNDRDGEVDEDYAAISQQMFCSVFYDTSTARNRSLTEDLHVPLGLEVRQESYAWTSQALEDFIGVEYKVKNISDSTIYSTYIAFMVDSDIGNARAYPQAYSDDMAGFADTTVSRVVVNESGTEVDVPFHLTVGYMYDNPAGQDGNVPGYFGVMFLGYAPPRGTSAPPDVGIHMFKQWSSGEEDPENDRERYRYMRGNSDTEKTIDPPTIKAADYRFLVSAGRFGGIPPDSTLRFQVAFVIGGSFDEFMTNAWWAQRTYERGWKGSSPPPPPKQALIPGDSEVIIEWDDYSETLSDPLSGGFDFAGYRIWKAVGWRHESTVPSAEQWRLIGHFGKEDLPSIQTGLTGIGKYRYVDKDVHNGMPYWYAVVGFDDGTADMRTKPGTTEKVPSPSYGNPQQAMQLVYPRGTPSVVNEKVTVVPNPYPGMGSQARLTGRAIGDMAEYEGDPSGRRVRFLNLPRQATVRVFSLSGDLVWTGYFEDPLSNYGEPPGWNLVSRNNQEIVSGTYLIHVESPLGSEVTKLIVVR